MNKTLLLGKIGEVPELKATKTGLPFVSFPMCTWETKKKLDAPPETVYEWHRIMCFGKRAEYVCKAAKKGDTVYVEGKQTLNEYNGKTTIQVKPTEVQIFKSKETTAPPNVAYIPKTDRQTTHQYSDDQDMFMGVDTPDDVA